MTACPVHRRPLARLAVALVSLLLLATTGTPVAHAEESWTWPVDGELLTPYRNGSDPYAAGQHRGVDLGAPVGSSVRAATDGTVTFAGTAGSSGLTVSIRTGDERFDTAYLHLGSVEVSEGDVVEEGTELGSVGTSGRRSTAAPHVHFGVRDAGERHAYRDPMLFLGAPGAPAPDPPAAPIAPPAPGPRPAPVPRPVEARAPQRSPAPAPAPHRAPAPEPLPAPKGAPAPGPLPRPAGAPRPVPGATPRRTDQPEPSPAPRPAPAPEPAHRPAAGPGRAPARAPAALGESPDVAPRDSLAGSAGGVDLGAVLACVGLAAALAVALRSRRSLGDARASERRSAASSIDTWPTTSPRRSTT